MSASVCVIAVMVESYASTVCRRGSLVTHVFCLIGIGIVAVMVEVMTTPVNL